MFCVCAACECIEEAISGAFKISSFSFRSLLGGLLLARVNIRSRLPDSAGGTSSVQLILRRVWIRPYRVKK